MSNNKHINTYEASAAKHRAEEWFDAHGFTPYGAAKSGKVHKSWQTPFSPRHEQRFLSLAACDGRTPLDNISKHRFGDAIEGDLCSKCFPESDGWVEVK